MQAVIILIIGATVTRGLLQNLENCTSLCKILSSQSKIEDCNCSSGYLDKVREIQQLYMSAEQIGNVDPNNPNDYLSNSHIKRRTYKSSKRHRVSRSRGESNHQRNDYQNYKQNLHETIIEHELPLYLDVHLNDSVRNRTLHDDLRNMFENLRSMEINISECLDLHIFIFSKNTDNVENTNWDQVVSGDKLSKSKTITEIQNICNVTNNFMVQNLYDIRKSLPKTRERSALTQNGQIENSVNVAETTISDEHANTIRNINNATFEEYATTTLTNKYYTNNYSSYNINYSVVSDSDEDKPLIDLDTKTRINDKSLQKHFKSSESPIHENSDEPKTFVITEVDPDQNDHTEEDNHSSHDNLITDNKFRHTSTEAISRPEYHEGEYLISKVITKELPNNSVTSVVDGYEIIPNLDFKKEITTSAPEVLSTENYTSLDLLTTDLSTFVTGQYTEQNTGNQKLQTSLEIRGELYFLYEKYQIPTRFIQKPDGKIHLAIDGITLCKQFLRQSQNKSAYMNLLCNCIVFENCKQN